MATAIERDQLRTIDGRITACQAKVRTIEDQISEQIQKLSDERHSYDMACRRLAAGQSADVADIKSRMDVITARIEGLKAALAEPKALLDTLISERGAAIAAHQVEEHEQAIAAEGKFVHDTIAEGLAAIAARNREAALIEAIVNDLRTHAYLNPRNCTEGKNGAMRIERIAAGMTA